MKVFCLFCYGTTYWNSFLLKIFHSASFVYIGIYLKKINKSKFIISVTLKHEVSCVNISKVKSNITNPNYDFIGFSVIHLKYCFHTLYQVC